MHLTAEHDGRLVADIVAEWASIHGEPFELVLEVPPASSARASAASASTDAIEHPRALGGDRDWRLSNPLPL